WCCCASTSFTKSSRLNAVRGAGKRIVRTVRWPGSFCKSLINYYEMYTGQQFFAGLGENDVLGKVLYNPQENQPQFPPSTPPAVAKLITTAIAKDRQRRYQRVEDLLRDMEALPSNLAWQDEKTEIFSPPSPDSGRRREEIKEKEQPTSQLPEVQPPAPKPSTRLPSLFWSGLALAVVTVVFLSIFRPFEKVLIPSAPPPSSPPLSQSEPRFAAPPAPLPSASSSPSAKQDVQEASSVTPPPLPLQMQGYLQVNVNVDTAEVSVDGRSVGVTRRDKPLEIRDLAVGKVRVRVEAEGYEPLERPVSVELNKWAQEAFVLNRLPAPEKTLAAPTSPNTEAPAIVQSAPQPQPEEQSSDEIVTFWTLDPSGQLVPQTQPAKSPQSRKKMQGK
ncbi:MAG: PEGA domain-containing protein, partial [Candidatus Binatia bacterium]